MRSIILLIFFLKLGFKSYGQTYTMQIDYVIPYEGCNGVEFNCNYKGIIENKLIDISSGSVGTIYKHTINNMPLINSIQLDVITNNICDITGLPRECYVSDSSVKYDISDIVKGNFLSAGGCGASTEITYFKPNGMTILSNQDTNCSGEIVNLTAYPKNFPNEAYHWQYSLDNQLTWIDVPDKLINNLPTNNSPTPSFTIKDILGVDHVNHFNIIHFRLGYSYAPTSIDRPFTDPIAIKYAPCAPILVDRTYIAPDCKGGLIKEITAYFQRPLELNETLSPMQIIPYPKVNGDPIFFSQQEEITSLVFDATKNLWAYKFKNLDSGRLINNRRYIIEYQANKNGVPRGTLQSFEPFIYNDPTAVQFEIVSAENPLCHDGTGEIVISVKGGIGAYKFYVNNIQKFPLPEPNGTYKLKDLDPKENKIKVTDSNDCIDNGKDD